MSELDPALRWALETRRARAERLQSRARPPLPPDLPEDLRVDVDAFLDAIAFWLEEELEHGAVFEGGQLAGRIEELKRDELAKLKLDDVEAASFLFAVTPSTCSRSSPGVSHDIAAESRAVAHPFRARTSGKCFRRTAARAHRERLIRRRKVT